MKRQVLSIQEELNNIIKKSEDGKLINEGINIGIIGRPNVDKSSLMNAMLNEERVVVSNVAGTTRDSIDSVLRYHNEEYVLIIVEDFVNFVCLVADRTC